MRGRWKITFLSLFELQSQSKNIKRRRRNAICFILVVEIFHSFCVGEGWSRYRFIFIFGGNFSVGLKRFQCGKCSRRFSHWIQNECEKSFFVVLQGKVFRVVEMERKFKLKLKLWTFWSIFSLKFEVFEWRVLRTHRSVFKFLKEEKEISNIFSTFWDILTLNC